ncbi:ABC-type antimicrobial peptide transport system permease subunit [Natronospira proteinivora]|uniref:ABC-type antimicrobial peptide transport system permease subunit n=1 Tax=Natronospira proteinivora TaxID=1807133 RepID=A0ABT1G893_9GAMM|nr:hypothetical protein [Natronospira proteinivora]MCP1727515.1 ABC-type antimicrobial peptide transport system permease subunit [Natronospira proteinivora]
MDKLGLVVTAVGALMAAFAAILLLYTATLVFSDSLYPALQAEQVSLAQASVLGFDFSGWGVLVPMLAYLLMGFVALALTRRQSQRFLAIWRERQ